MLSRAKPRPSGVRVAKAALVGAILLVLPPSPASAGEHETCAAMTSGPDVEAIKRLELRGAAINVEGWSQEEAQAFFAPEWLSVQPDGSDIKLDGVFSRFRDGRSPGWAESFLLPELDIRVYCGTAIVIGRGEIRPRGATAPSQTVRVRYLNVWRKENGRWVCCRDPRRPHAGCAKGRETPTRIPTIRGGA